MYIYLDNSASTKPSEAVMRVVQKSMEEEYFNPSSLYKPGLIVEKEMQACRVLVKEQLHAHEVIFTSGGTEANNLAIQGHLPANGKGKEILYGAGEHPSVTNACRAMEKKGFVVRPIPYTIYGEVDLDALSSMLSEKTALVCIMHVNNEVGTIQDLAKAAELIREKSKNAFFHVDGVQAFLKVPADMKKLSIDSYTISGHKVHALKGIGALCLSDKARISPMIFGGGQERSVRSGTENTHGIMALKAAIENYPKHDMQGKKMLLYRKLKDMLPLRLNGYSPDSEKAAPHILNVSFPPVRAETMLHALEGEEIYVGNGSACSSRHNDISHVLAAMELSKSDAESAIRFSLSPFTTENEIEITADKCVENYRLLSKFVRK